MAILRFRRDFLDEKERTLVELKMDLQKQVNRVRDEMKDQITQLEEECLQLKADRERFLETQSTFAKREEELKREKEVLQAKISSNAIELDMIQNASRLDVRGLGEDLTQVSLIDIPTDESSKVDQQANSYGHILMDRIAKILSPVVDMPSNPSIEVGLASLELLVKHTISQSDRLTALESNLSLAKEKVDLLQSSQPISIQELQNAFPSLVGQLVRDTVDQAARNADTKHREELVKVSRALTAECTRSYQTALDRLKTEYEALQASLIEKSRSKVERLILLQRQAQDRLVHLESKHTEVTATLILGSTIIETKVCGDFEENER
jgi:hypothetical protein